MSMIFVVLPLTLVIAGCAVAAFVWAVRQGQLDDLDTPPWRMLHDEAPTHSNINGDASASTSAHQGRRRERRPSD